MDISKKTMETSIQFLLDDNKKILAKFTKFRDEIKHLLKTINEGKKGEYEKDFMKIKFNSDDNLSLKNSKEDGKYYPQVFLDECLYEYK